MPGLRRLAIRGLVVLVLDWGALLALGALLGDFDVHGAAGALVTAVIAAALNALVWPTLSRLALPLSVLTLGGAAIVLNCPNAAAHVRRTDGFPHCPDLLVNASFSSDTEEVAAFEELVGWHGGMGGSQSLPFVLFPSDLPFPDEEVVGRAHAPRAAPLAGRARPRRLPRRGGGHGRWRRRLPTSIAMTVTR